MYCISVLLLRQNHCHLRYSWLPNQMISIDIWISVSISNVPPQIGRVEECCCCTEGLHQPDDYAHALNWCWCCWYWYYGYHAKYDIWLRFWSWLRFRKREWFFLIVADSILNKRIWNNQIEQWRTNAIGILGMSIISLPKRKFSESLQMPSVLISMPIYQLQSYQTTSSIQDFIQFLWFYVP